ncbi:MAG: hypothetical protein AB7G13_25745 [Lautropia sp.]
MLSIASNPVIRAGARSRCRAGREAIRRAATRSLTALAVAGALLASPAAPALAQIRPIPETAKLGTLTVGHFPNAVLNGKPVTLGPGARIRDVNNLFVVPSTLKDSSRTVAYATGSLGEIVDVWILSEAEVGQIRARQSSSR